MVSSRSAALEAIMRLALTQNKIQIDDVIDASDQETSRRTARRAFKDAEGFGWVEKDGPNANSWHPGERARETRIAERHSGYEDADDLPQMYYVSAGNTAPDCLFGERVMVSAGVAWRNSGDGFNIGVPDATHLMVDSGGFQAAVHFRDEYPYSPEQLHTWADRIRADVVWGMDWACESTEVLAKAKDIDPDKIAPVDVRYQRAWEDQMRQFKEHQEGRYGHEFRPVVQGNTVSQFKDFAARLRESPMPDERIAIGTVCKMESNRGILKVLEAVTEELPDSYIHLFGATLNVWKDPRFVGRFHSSDSAAWRTHYGDNGEYASGQQELTQAHQEYSEKVEKYKQEYHD
jgi:hypothetical protein